MAGMMWRQFVVLLVFVAWQVSSAEALIDLIEPRVAKLAPRTDLYLQVDGDPEEDESWKLIDNDTSTYMDMWRGRRIKMWFMKGLRQPYPLRTTKVRMTLAAHAREQDVPWIWHFQNGQEVRRSEIINGVFEFDFDVRPDFPFLKLKYKAGKDVPIAEIELLGSRKALDALWPDGTYPCSQRLEMITPVKGELFSVANNDVSQETLQKVFSSDVDRDVLGRRYTPGPPAFDYDGNKPVIIGVKFAEIPTVHEVMLHGFRWYYVQGVKKIVLEAHECEPSCSNGGSKGWVRLEEKLTPKSFFRTALLEPFYLSTPGMYKAYRLKFHPKRYTTRPERRPESMDVTSIFFLGCNA